MSQSPSFSGIPLTSPTDHDRSFLSFSGSPGVIRGLSFPPPAPFIALTTFSLSLPLVSPTGFRISAVSSNAERTKNQLCLLILSVLLLHSRPRLPIRPCHPSTQTSICSDPHRLMLHPLVPVESGRVALARRDLDLGHNNSMPSKNSIV